MNSTKTKGKRKNYKPMAGGETDIQSANPPPDLEPRSTPISKASKSDKEAKEQPRKQNHRSGLKKHSLRLSKLLDGIK